MRHGVRSLLLIAWLFLSDWHPFAIAVERCKYEFHTVHAHATFQINQTIDVYRVETIVNYIVI